MPPMPVVAVPMAFELATYGAAAGFLYRKFPKSIPGIYASLVIAMIAGGNVLLSPACASFDMFVDYEDRGRVFKKKVLGLK